MAETKIGDEWVSLTPGSIVAIPSNSVHCTRAVPSRPFLCFWMLMDGPFATIKYNFLDNPDVDVASSNFQPPLVFAPVVLDADSSGAAAEKDEAAVATSPLLWRVADATHTHPADAAITFGWRQWVPTAGMPVIIKPAPTVVVITRGHDVVAEFVGSDDTTTTPSVIVGAGRVVCNPDPTMWPTLRLTSASPGQMFWVQR